MKRKLLVIAMVVMLTMVVFTGCAKEEAPVEKEQVETPVEENKETEVAGDLVDGTYLVKNEVSDHGNFGMGTLEVENGEVAKLEYNEYLIDSGEAEADDNYGYAEAIAVIKDLNEQFNEKKDLAEVDFDAVSGATHTKEEFKLMVETLLDKAAKGETYEALYTDGIYEAEAEEESHGWLSVVRVVVKDGEIVGLDMADKSVEDPEVRRTPENYELEEYFTVVKGLQKQIIDNNGTDNLDLDGLTGATNTREGMVELVNKALESAK